MGTFSSSYRIGTYPSEVYILLDNFGLIVQKLQLEWSDLIEFQNTFIKRIHSSYESSSERPEVVGTICCTTPKNTILFSV